MAYDTEDLKKRSLEAIKKYNLIFVADVLIYLPCSKQTFYTHKLDQVDEIKDALEANKLRTKQALRKQWYESGNPSLQMALYRLMATPEEHARLAPSANVLVLDGNGEDTEDVPTIIVQDIKKISEQK